MKVRCCGCWPAIPGCGWSRRKRQHGSRAQPCIRYSAQRLVRDKARCAAAERPGGAAREADCDHFSGRGTARVELHTAATGMFPLIAADLGRPINRSDGAIFQYRHGERHSGSCAYLSARRANSGRRKATISDAHRPVPHGIPHSGGVVITFVDVTHLKEAELYAESIVARGASTTTRTNSIRAPINSSGMRSGARTGWKHCCGICGNIGQLTNRSWMGRSAR
jgi:hypothetical protein